MPTSQQNVMDTVCKILFKSGISIDEFVSHIGIKVNKRLLKEPAAIEYLNISQGSFQEFVKSGKINQVAMGPKTIRYDLENLNEFILDHTISKTHESEVAIL